MSMNSYEVTKAAEWEHAVEWDAWFDELLIEDKKLREAGKICKVCGDTENWCPDFK